MTVARDMVIGLCCALCSVYFVQAHGHPVLCRSCWKDTPKKERQAEGYQKASKKEVE